ncbi:MAG: hypothetical protein JST86_00135 [Bacteroidetes bacterium]|nr:hypothetical protein [Bacteroidota bacterium]
MKWQLLSYNQKLKLLGVAALAMLVLCYQYGFKNTWAVYNEYQENKTRTDQLENYTILMPEIKSEEKRINDLIKNNLSDTLYDAKETLAFVTTFCKNKHLKLTEYQPVQVTENSSFNIATRQITVEGDYTGLLMLLFEMENHQNYGRLCSAVFKSTEDASSGKITLSCTFFLQNLIRK